MKPTSRWTLFICVAALAMAPAIAANKWLLRMDMDEGASYRFELDQSSTIDIGMGAMGSQQITSGMGLEWDQAITSSSAAGVSFDIIYRRVTLDSAVMGNELNYDSDNPDSDPELAKVLGRMVDKKISFDVTSRGSIASVSGVDSMAEDAKASIQDPMNLLAEQSFGDDAIRTLLDQISLTFPEGKVGAGESWNRKGRIENLAMGKLDVDTTYTLQSTESCGRRKCAKIGMDSTLKFDGDPPLIKQIGEQLGPNAKFDWEPGDMKVSGTAWVDLKSGLTVKLETTTGIEITMSLDMGVGGEAMPFEMGVEITQALALAE